MTNENSYGIFINNGEVNLKKESQIIINEKQSYGITLNGNGKTNLHNSNITLNGRQSSGILIKKRNLNLTKSKIYINETYNIGIESQGGKTYIINSSFISENEFSNVFSASGGEIEINDNNIFNKFYKFLYHKHRKIYKMLNI